MANLSNSLKEAGLTAKRNFLQMWLATPTLHCPNYLFLDELYFWSQCCSTDCHFMFFSTLLKNRVLQFDSADSTAVIKKAIYHHWWYPKEWETSKYLVLWHTYCISLSVVSVAPMVPACCVDLLECKTATFYMNNWVLLWHWYRLKNMQIFFLFFF